MGQGMIHLLTLFAQHIIGEVVVFINYQIKRNLPGFCRHRYRIEFRGSILAALHLRNRIFIIILRIFLDKLIEHNTGVGIEVIIERTRARCSKRIIKKQHLIATLQRSGMLLYPSILKERWEILLSLHIVIGRKHSQEDALSKASGTDKIEEVSRLLYLWYEHTLICPIAILVAQLGKG